MEQKIAESILMTHKQCIMNTVFGIKSIENPNSRFDIRITMHTLEFGDSACKLTLDNCLPKYLSRERIVFEIDFSVKKYHNWTNSVFILNTNSFTSYC